MIDWLYGLRHFGIKLGLDNIRALLRALDHPERAQPSILVAGTNGKGSVAAMLHAMLESSGLRTGLFTSPHLVRPTERIRLGASDISPGALDALLSRMKHTIEHALERGWLESHPSFFEVITASALEAFREAALDAAVLEVGLGGRLDATNAVDAETSVIVNVDLDHLKTLGPTIEAIAVEKAGIIKPGRPLVSGVVRQRALGIIEQVCRQRGARLIDARLAVDLDAEHDDGAIDLVSECRRYDGLRLALAGRHQFDNARVAIAALEQFARIVGFEPEPERVRQGLAAVRWPGRLQWMRDRDAGPDLLFDGAHNPAGMRTLTGYLRTLPGPPPVAVFGAMRDKLLAPMLDDLTPCLHAMIVTRPDIDRAWEPDELEAEVRQRLERVELVRDTAQALARAQEIARADNRFVLVTGSLYLIGTVLASLEDEPAPGPVAM